MGEQRRRGLDLKENGFEVEEEGIEVTLQAIWYRLKEGRWSWKTARPYDTAPRGMRESKKPSEGAI
jgi:hypothetical protein